MFLNCIVPVFNWINTLEYEAKNTNSIAYYKRLVASRKQEPPTRVEVSDVNVKELQNNVQKVHNSKIGMIIADSITIPIIKK